MIFKEVIDKESDFYSTKYEFEEEFYLFLQKMGFPFSDVFVDIRKIEVKTKKKFSKENIKFLEDEFEIKLTLCEKTQIHNIDESLFFLGKYRKSILYKYVFRCEQEE